MQASRDACDSVDLFIAPSRQLMHRHIVEFGIPEEKIKYLDYGFDLNRLQGRVRDIGEPFVFGYIGRHHPSKGIHHLIDAFGQIEGDSILRIWGRPQGQLTQSLQRRCESYDIPQARIEWLPEYNNEDIVSEVFNRCDCIVAPSIWDENSPLVIHEAQQCSVPVITANHGGMGEYVKDGINGLTHRHRDAEDLRMKMQAAVENPESFLALGSTGYLFSDGGQIPSKETHASSIIDHYRRLLHRKMGVEA
jgi:glycosyltransferase involved in cell wall biosynthesis